MSIEIKDALGNIESDLSGKVENNIRETGDILNKKMNDHMNNYQRELENKMNGELDEYRKELEKLFPEEEDKIEQEIMNRKNILIGEIYEKLDIRYKDKLDEVQKDLKKVLSTNMGNEIGNLGNNVLGQFGKIGSIIGNSLNDKFSLIEDRLGDVEQKLGFRVAKKIVSRAERLNGNIGDRLTTVATGLVNRESTKAKLDEIVKSTSKLKLNELINKSSGDFTSKIADGINVDIGNKIDLMIGRDIKWEKSEIH